MNLDTHPIITYVRRKYRNKSIKGGETTNDPDTPLGRYMDGSDQTKGLI